MHSWIISALLFDPNVPAVGDAVVERLSRKDLRHVFHRLRLVGLHGEFEFHLGHYSTFLCVFGL